MQDLIGRTCGIGQERR